MKADAVLLVKSQKIDLLLKFVRVGPIIIPFAESNVTPADGGNGGQAVFIGSDVLRAQGDAEPFGITFLIAADYCLRIICRSIVADDNLIWKSRLLHQETIQGCRNKGTVIVTDADDRNERF